MLGVGMRAVLLDWGGVLDDFGDPPQQSPPVLSAVYRLRACAIATALVSNGHSRTGVPTDVFDVCAVSGELGIAKPAGEIYRFTADRLGCAPGECVFVDDSASNVAAAVRAGMVGVRHEKPELTVAELEALFPAD